MHVVLSLRNYKHIPIMVVLLRDNGTMSPYTIHHDFEGCDEGDFAPCKKLKVAVSNMCLDYFANIFIHSSPSPRGWRRIGERAIPQISVIGRGSAPGFRYTVGIRLLTLSHPSPAMVRMSKEQKAARMRQIVNGRPMDEWDKCWAEGVTPWDLGQATPIIKHLADNDLLPQGRALVPGCGAGYDVLALGCPDRYVVGLDISKNALKRAHELAASAPNAQYVEFLNADFFTWTTPELFDLLFDYTFFCAIEPPMRPDWAKRVAELLKPDGELITLMFPIGEHVDGPPYAVSVQTYEEVLHPVGFKAVLIEDNKMAIEPRKGRELLGRWKRKDVAQSSL